MKPVELAGAAAPLSEEQRRNIARRRAELEGQLRRIAEELAHMARLEAGEVTP